MNKKNKYNAIKTKVDGIIFDSKIEALYYSIHKKIPFITRQEKFILQEKFKLNGKNYREICYVADFVFRNENGQIMKVVDCKGVLTDVFKLKAKLFTQRYGLPITIAKKVARLNMFIEEDY